MIPWQVHPSVDTFQTLNLGSTFSQTNRTFIGKAFILRIQICGQAHLSCLTPDPLHHGLCVGNPKDSWLFICQQPFYLNQVLAFDFPELKQRCTLLCEAEQKPPVPGLPASQTALWGWGWAFGFLRSCWRFFFFFTFYWQFFFSPRGSLETGEWDTMGCCSGRCTLAFICGMQLVSLKIFI